MQGTHGAELNPALERASVDAIVDAGYRRDLEGYSGFEETDLAELLRDARHRARSPSSGSPPTTASRRPPPTPCARASASPIDRGGIRGIDVEPGDSERALDELRAAGAEVS